MITTFDKFNGTTIILNDNVSRKGVCIFNNTTKTIYVSLDSDISTYTYTLALAAGSYYEVPNAYVGAVTGLVSANANGCVQVTDW